MKHPRIRVGADSGQHKRILLISAFLGILGFLPVILQLYGLMITDFDYYSEKARRNQSRTTAVLPPRGEIYDRNMNLLACSRSVENVYLNPRELEQSDADLYSISRELGRILNKDPDWIQKQGENLKRRYQQIAFCVEEETGREIRAYMNAGKISGIHLEPNTRRYYPYGSLACHVLGFTNDSGTGSEGIEAAYNSYLEGDKGRVITTKGNNEMDIPFSYEDFVQGKKSCSLVLTLDTTVQQCLEKQMTQAVDRYDVQNGAFGLVMNVNTGEILAMATLGGYDPNHYLEIADGDRAQQVESLRMAYLAEPKHTEAYRTGEAAWRKALRQAQLEQWRNRCISDGYEPGSTFKVITMAAALDCGAISLDTPFFCRGSEQIPGRAQKLHCWKSAGHGAEKTPQALQNSCNIAFAHIALKLGGERFYDYVKRFGILEKTGIDLLGESKGVFFNRAVVTDTDKWGTASLTSGSFGQTFKLTPLQLVRGIGAVVNGGRLMEPYLVSQVVDEQGRTVLQQEPTVVRQVISQETSRTMCALLESVVSEGTARNAHVAGFRVGGKTGTSEKIDVFDAQGRRVQDKIVSFVGVAPMDNPEYIVLVALDTPSRATGTYISGGVMAAPTVGGVLGDILPYLGVKRFYKPEDAAGRQVVLEDFTGVALQDAEKKLTQLGLSSVIRGKGECVVAQIPAPGQSVPGNGQVILYLEEEPMPEPVTVPDFKGMNRQKAAHAAGVLGLSVLVSGNDSLEPQVVVSEQSPSAGESVPPGTTIQLKFTDETAED